MMGGMGIGEMGRGKLNEVEPKGRRVPNKRDPTTNWGGKPQHQEHIPEKEESRREGEGEGTRVGERKKCGRRRGKGKEESKGSGLHRRSSRADSALRASSSCTARHTTRLSQINN